LLYSCFANQAWAAAVAGARPFDDLPALFRAAESAWAKLTPADWMGAIAAHPRIGEGGGASPRLSSGEQSRVMEAQAATLEALAVENRRYESRFGHVFLISARGRSAEEILEALRTRLNNDPAAELETAAIEHRKITRLRLEQVLA